jgi:hypothetical protein
MLPNTVNGFELQDKTDDTFLYENAEVDVTVSAATAPDGSGGSEWVVSVVAPGSAGGTIATGLSGKSEAKTVAIDYMENYPTGGRDDAGGSNGGMMDETMNDSDGGLLSRASEAGQRVASKAADATRSALDASGDGGDSSLGDLFEEPDRSGPSALERFSDDRDRGTSALFDDTMGGSAGPGVFDELDSGRSRDGPSAFERFSDDRDRGTPSVFDDTMRGSSGPSVFDELGTDEDTGSRLERLQNAEDPDDLYGGGR